MSYPESRTREEFFASWERGVTDYDINTLKDIIQELISEEKFMVEGEEYEELENQVASLSEERDDLESDINKLNDKIDDLINDLDERDDEITELKKCIAEDEQEISDLKGRLHDLSIEG